MNRQKATEKRWIQQFCDLMQLCVHMTECRSSVFDRVLLVEAVFEYPFELYRAPWLPALAGNRPSPEPRT